MEFSSRAQFGFSRLRLTIVKISITRDGMYGEGFSSIHTEELSSFCGMFYHPWDVHIGDLQGLLSSCKNKYGNVNTARSYNLNAIFHM